MTTAAQARYIESLRDDRDRLDLDDDHIQDNIARINRRLTHYGEAIDQEALTDWIEGLIEQHNHELECDLDTLSTTEASALIDALKDGYHPALITNLDEVAVHLMPYIIKEVKAFVAERAEKVEEKIERAEHIAGGTAADSEEVDALVEEAVAYYDAYQIEQALGVQGECETREQAEWTISKAGVERLEARLKEAEAQLAGHTSAQVAADVVRRVSTRLLAGDAERDMIRRYIASKRAAESARATDAEGLSSGQHELLSRVVEADRRVHAAEEALAELKRERAEAARAAVDGGVTQYRIAQATGRQQSAVAQWRKTH